MNKRYCTVYCFLLFGFALISCDSGINDESKRNENWAWLVDAKGQGQWVPITSEQGTVTGVYTLFYSTGEVYETGYIQGGIKIDSVLVYAKSGDSLRYIIYESDSIYRSHYLHDGPYSETFQTGEVKLEGTVKNNLQHGAWKQYSQNGTLTWECNLIDQTGWELNYFDSGMRKDCTHYVNGEQTGVLHVWYENGNLEQITYWKNNIQDSIQTYYHENGELLGVELERNGKLQDSATKFWPNGNIKSQCYYVNDVRHGEFRRYHENGKIDLVAQFDYGVKQGKWYWYDTTSALYQVDTYSNNDLMNVEKK